MNEDVFRIIELSQQGFYCSQILLQLGLEAQGKQNPDLIRSMNGLAWGIGFSGNVCGALSGGACLLGLYVGKGTPEEAAHDSLIMMILQLVEWFKTGIGSQHGGITCYDIMGEEPGQKGTDCGRIVIETYWKVKEILQANQFALDGKTVTDE